MVVKDNETFSSSIIKKIQKNITKSLSQEDEDETPTGKDFSKLNATMICESQVDVASVPSLNAEEITFITKLQFLTSPYGL